MDPLIANMPSSCVPGANSHTISCFPSQPIFPPLSGIILPESAKAKIPQGTVVAVGPGEKNMDGNIVPMNIAVDANVFLPEYGGTKIPVADGEAELFLYREDEILAIIED